MRAATPRLSSEMNRTQPGADVPSCRYIALSMTHGIVCTLMVANLERILHQPRHKALTGKPLRRITQGRCAWVLRELVKMFKVSSSLNYSNSVAKVIAYYSELARPDFDDRILISCTKLYITYWTRRCVERTSPPCPSSLTLLPLLLLVYLTSCRALSCV